MYLSYITPIQNWKNKTQVKLTGNSPSKGNRESFRIIEKEIENIIYPDTSEEIELIDH